MSIDKYLGIGYKLTDSKNFDEFMKELGVGLVTRKLANSISATVTLTKENDTYTLSTASTFKNTVISFKLGEEFDEETIDGRNVKTTITVDGNKLVQKQKGSPDTEIVREYSDDKMTATMTVKEVVAVRTYDKV